MYFADANESGSLSASRLRTPNSTGAGDAMVAGIARGMLEGLSTQDCASLGQQAVISHLIGQGGTLL